MRLPKFEYKAPKTIEEAVSILSESKGDATILAGGTDVIVAMKQIRLTPKILVDIKNIEGIDAIKEGDKYIRIGALVTLTSIAESSVIKKKIPSLAKAAEEVGAPQHRNAGTIGGNLCLNTRCWYYNQSEFYRQCRPVCYKFGGADDNCQLFPASKGKEIVCYSVFSGDTAVALISLGAEVKVIGTKGERVIPVADLYTGDGKHPISLAHDEILTEVIVPNPSPSSSGAYLKYRVREAIDFPLVGVAASITLNNDGSCEKANIVVGAVASKPVVVPEAGDILKGNKITDDLLEKVAEAVHKAVKPLPNLIDGTPKHRRHMASVYAKRSIKAAVANITG